MQGGLHSDVHRCRILCRDTKGERISRKPKEILGGHERADRRDRMIRSLGMNVGVVVLADPTHRKHGMNIHFCGVIGHIEKSPSAYS